MPASTGAATDATPVSLEMPNSFVERLKANVIATSSFRTSMLWCVGFFLLAAAVFANALFTTGRLDAFAIVAAVLPLAFPPLLILWNTWRAYTPRTPGHTIVISDAGVRTPSIDSAFLQEWKTIRSVLLRGGYLMLLTRQSAYVIPLHLLDRAQLDRVARFARNANVEHVAL